MFVVVVLLKFVRMAATILIFLLMIHGVSGAGWAVSYSSSHICALKHTTVIMSCTYTYPPEHKIEKVFWTKVLKQDLKDSSEEKYADSPDLSEDPEYSQRLQYLGDKQKNCTIRLSHVTEKDQHKYYFRFITNKDRKWLGLPGVTLTVTDLQVEAPERVTEGDSVRLTCKSSCALTDRATFIWYRNSQPLTERRDTNNQLLLQSVRREDAGRYSCDVEEDTHSLSSPAAQITVMYPPKSVSVSISPSEIVEGDSVTLSCSSDSNPPAEISWIKGGTTVGSGRIYSISKIRSDHSGAYKCKSRNKHGENDSDAVTLNVTYPPRSVSVSITGSGEIVEGDSVTLICSSDSNPPALNFSWFKEDQSSSVGSGQSFRALQSGRFYCEAHNQHGSQRSHAVTVTVHRRKFLYAVAGVTGVLGLIFIFIIVLMTRKKQKPNDITQKQDDLYVNVSAHNASLSESDAVNQTDALYSLITLSHNQTEGEESDSEEEIQYVTVLHHRNKETSQPEKNESHYDNIGQHRTDAARRSADQLVENQSVIYSTLK